MLFFSLCWILFLSLFFRFFLFFLFCLREELYNARVRFNPIGKLLPLHLQHIYFSGTYLHINVLVIWGHHSTTSFDYWIPWFGYIYGKKRGETLSLEPYSIYLFQQFRERNALIIAYTQTILISFFHWERAILQFRLPGVMLQHPACAAALCFFYISSSSLFNGIRFSAMHVLSVCAPTSFITQAFCL